MSDMVVDIFEAARRLGVSESTARRIFKTEPGVLRITTPGHRRPMVRVPIEVVERVRAACANAVGNGGE
jgi:hypothetical protein